MNQEYRFNNILEAGIPSYSILTCLLLLASASRLPAQACQIISGTYPAGSQVSWIVTVPGATQYGGGPAQTQETIRQTNCDFTVTESAGGLGTANLSGYFEGNTALISGVNFAITYPGFAVTNQSASGTGYLSGSTLTFSNLSLQLSGFFTNNPFSAQETINMNISGVSSNGLGAPIWVGPGCTYLGSGWWKSSWLGTFNDNGDPWIYHQQHGFMYVDGTDPSSLWFYNSTGNMGYLWTSSTVYPWLWSDQEQTWLYYDVGSQSPRWFFNWNSQKWEAHNP